MLSFLENISLYILLSFILSAIFIILGILKLFISFLVKKNYKVSNIEKWLMAFFILYFSFTLLISKYRAHYVLNEINSLISLDTTIVQMESGKTLNKTQLAKALSKIKKFKHSGSFPTRVFSVFIISDESHINIHFKRDSRNNKLFWIFYPNFLYQGNIGYVETNIFEKNMTDNNRRQPAGRGR